MRNQSIVRCAITIAMVLAAVMARADNNVTGYLYVSDYGNSNLDRYQYTFDTTTNKITAIAVDGYNNSTTSAVLISGNIKEGVEGTANDLIIVGGTRGATTSITRYYLDGQFLGTIPVNFSAYNGGNPGIGNVVVTPDGKYMYAPLEAASAIVKISLATGAIVSSIPFASAHDIAIASYNTTTGAAVLYASNYSATSPSVVVIADNGTNTSSSLTQTQTLISNATLTSSVHGLSAQRPTGLTVASDGSLYVNMNNSSQSGPDGVEHYTITGIGTSTLTANYDALGSLISNTSLHFTFGNNLGPDGNLYIAALGGGNGSFQTGKGQGNVGYTDGVYEFNTSTNTITNSITGLSNVPFIAGMTEGTNSGIAGFSAPKYLQFSTNFAPVGDVGVPEPGSVAMVFAAAVGVSFMFHRKRRTSRESDPW
jgi:hypothetical protein